MPGPAPGGLLAGLDGRPLEGAARARAETLAARYDLAPLLAVCGAVERAESLYVLDLLDQHGLAGDGVAGRGLDVGSKNGAYLPGLAAAWPGGWDAVEIDAHRRYWTLHTRRARGEAMAAALPGCAFHAADVRDLPGAWARLTWLLPFVTETPHRAWGLDRATFGPDGLLADVLGKLAPGGVMLLVNQGEEERDAQGELLAVHPDVRVEALGEVTSTLSPFRRTRYGWRVTRP